MSIADEINKGIGAHGMWKQRLLNAIKTGESEWNPDIVCQDNQCDFGKWIYSCSSKEQLSPHYSKVKNLHAEFHKTAAGILSLALSNKKAEAEAAIGDNSKYKTLSADLTREMMGWKIDES